MNLVADYDVNNGRITRTYTYGPGVDNIQSMTTYDQNGNPAETYYYIKDASNTVHVLVDEDGLIVEYYYYDAFGNFKMRDKDYNLITESVYGNRFLFQGREYDYDTALYYFRARWYEPETGRWLSPDPIGISGGLNLYAFCGNDPVNFVDPSGLFVVMILDKKNNTLRVSDAGRKITVQAFTGGHLADDGTIILQGGEGENPIPNGMYWIVENPNPKGYSGWYGVVKVDNRIDDYFYEGEKERSGIRLHLGKVSHGCVTVSNKQPNANEKWNEICEALDNTETDLIDFRVPHRPCSKKLIRYGSILVK